MAPSAGLSSSWEHEAGKIAILLDPFIQALGIFATGKDIKRYFGGKRKSRKLRERMTNPWKRKQESLNILSYTEQPAFMAMNLGKIRSSESFVTSGRLTRMLFPSLLF